MLMDMGRGGTLHEEGLQWWDGCMGEDGLSCKGRGREREEEEDVGADDEGVNGAQ